MKPFVFFASDQGAREKQRWGGQSMLKSHHRNIIDALLGRCFGPWVGERLEVELIAKERNSWSNWTSVAGANSQAVNGPPRGRVLGYHSHGSRTKQTSITSLIILGARGDKCQPEIARANEEIRRFARSDGYRSRCVCASRLGRYNHYAIRGQESVRVIAALRSGLRGRRRPVALDQAL